MWIPYLFGPGVFAWAMCSSDAMAWHGLHAITTAWMILEHEDEQDDAKQRGKEICARERNPCAFQEYNFPESSRSMLSLDVSHVYLEAQIVPSVCENVPEITRVLVCWRKLEASSDVAGATERPSGMERRDIVTGAVEGESLTCVIRVYLFFCLIFS